MFNFKLRIVKAKKKNFKITKMHIAHSKQIQFLSFKMKNILDFQGFALISFKIINAFLIFEKINYKCSQMIIS